jgi:polyphosphate kinase
MNIVATTPKTLPFRRHRVPAGIFPESRDEPARFQSAGTLAGQKPAHTAARTLRFLCIVSSNLDEFFEIREAGIKEQLKLNSVAITTDGKTAREVYRLVSDEVHSIVKEQYALLNEEILPQLATEGIRFLKRGDWNDAQREWIRDFFFREVMPVITPIGLDPSHPFPRVLNKSLNFAVELEGRDAFGRSSGAAIVQAPRVLPRVIRLPRELGDSEYAFVFLSSICTSSSTSCSPE